MRSVIRCLIAVALLAVTATQAGAVIPRDPATTTTAAPVVIHDSTDGYAGVGQMYASTVEPAAAPAPEAVVVSSEDTSVWWLVFIAAGSAVFGAGAMFVVGDVRRRRFARTPAA